MNKEDLENFIAQGFSIGKIAKTIGKSKGMVRNWLNKFELKTKHKNPHNISRKRKEIDTSLLVDMYLKGDSVQVISEFFNCSPSLITMKLQKQNIIPKKKISFHKEYDWTLIQQDYDSGLTWDDLTIKYKISSNMLAKARKSGKFKSRSNSEARKISKKKWSHSQETKDKISKIRRKFLEENPDKVPYLINHSSKPSYPEIVFAELLTKNGITGWKSHVQKSIYEYDFCFEDLKLDVEIDGSTHKQPKVQAIDKRRDEWTVSQGWKVLRFEAEFVKKNPNLAIEQLLRFIESVESVGLAPTTS